ncbi:MAG: sn-glycerol-3-phosphate ABC transporter ATP-binding protein UgpC [Corynebacterium sp.]|uniref:ABC transporter ATP-binding protein n=1 Tax=Corynebacterium sp. TaxID=1720 RepID=UPI0026DF8BD1|nr:sn-glycerol-3-phosphate ABC transporter ATP-binding protein UgpC [Corynebacterium sp.]MDO5670185.1 sn-glycerol-3-phosphate ABC transporter ATP-binding protein UgpC [Corynebacterium sp.]
MATVSFREATRVYEGSTVPAVDSLNLEIGDGEFMVFVGPSGCGKSTSLRMLAGLEEVNSGEVWIGDREVTHVPAKDRDIAMVFQNYALYPHMTVADNMSFALKISGVGKEDRSKRIQEAAKMLGLEDFLDRKPKNLSGGQRQRVAMGRAIVRNPSVFLMDEPLSNLDAKLRVQTRTQIAALQNRLGVSTVYVTHDQVEAMTMGDRVAVMNRGVLQQVDSPLALYDAPANLFVANFIGSPSMSLFDAEIVDGGVTVAGHHIPVAREVLDRATGATVVIGIRPEAFDLADGEDGIATRINVVEQTGADSYFYGELHTSEQPSSAESSITARVQTRQIPAAGDIVVLTVDPTKVHVFDKQTKQRISGVVTL